MKVGWNCIEGLHESVATLLLKWACEVELGWSSTLNQGNLLSRSREQICSYFKAAPLFVMIKLSETPISQCWLERWPSFCKRLFFQREVDRQQYFVFWNKDTCLAFIGSWVSGFHPFGNTVCIGIWKCLEKHEIVFRTVSCTDKGRRIYPSCYRDRYWNWKARLYDELIPR